MGNSLCSQEPTISGPVKCEDNFKNLTFINQPDGDFQEEDVECDEKNPLQNFINNPQKNRLITASNSLNLGKIQKEQTNIEIVYRSGRSQKKGKANKNYTQKRVSINIKQNECFSEPFSASTDQNIETDSYQRIEIRQEQFIQMRKEDINKYYVFEEVVGEGAFGSVYRATCAKSQEVRAIKIIKRQNLGINKKNEVFAELELLKKMDHPNIIKLYQVFESKSNYYIVTEYCKGGSIIDFIKSRKVFNESIIKQILNQLLGCLNYLHKIRIVHRDIKLQNVVFINKVIDKCSTEQIEIKLLDFGTAFYMNKSKVKCRDLVGTVSYMAPQIIKGYFTTKCDVWSCGVIMYILLTSRSPFKCKKKEQTIDKILNHQIKYAETVEMADASPQSVDLIRQLLEKDQSKRISAEVALKHPWFFKNSKINKVHSSLSLINLSNYYRHNNLITVMESYLIFAKVSEAERKKINTLFKQIDVNSDGSIQKFQLIQLYKNQSRGKNTDEIESIMSKLDKDKSGRIDLNEFTSAMIDRQSLFVKDSLLEAFDYFDSDKTGFIERKELEVLMQGCEIKQLQDIIKELDLDHDDRISKEEFLSYMLKKGCLYS